MHLLTLVKFTNISIFFTNVSKNLRKSTLVNPKIYVNFWAPKFTSFGDSGFRAQRDTKADCYPERLVDQGLKPNAKNQAQTQEVALQVE